MASDLEAAWDILIAAIPPDWTVERPSWHVERNEWHLYAWDTSERARVGKRWRDWTAVAATEVGVVHEMARCLWAIGQGRVPK